jgi:hypothetical protein
MARRSRCVAHLDALAASGVRRFALRRLCDRHGGADLGSKSYPCRAGWCTVVQAKFSSVWRHELLGEKHRARRQLLRYIGNLLTHPLALSLAVP